MAPKSPVRRAARSRSRTAGLKFALYRPLFEEIDKDGNGVVDASELHGALLKTFPALTPKAVRKMLSEADVNHDGVLSLEEFSAIMTAAEGKNTAWGKAQKSLWENWNQHLRETVAVLHSAAEPLKAISRKHSRKEGGKQVANVGLRLAAGIMEGFLLLYCYAFLFQEGFRTQEGVGQEVILGSAGRLPEWITYGGTGIVLCLECLCFSRGQDIVMHLADMQMVDVNGTPFGFWSFLLSQIIFLLCFPAEWLSLHLRGHTISQSVMGGIVVVLPPAETVDA